MKKMLMMLLIVSVVAVSSAGVFAHEAGLRAAATYPYEIISESYVPSLYFSVASNTDVRLVPASHFPYETCDLCYTPALYYEAGKVAAVEKVR